MRWVIEDEGNKKIQSNFYTRSSQVSDTRSGQVKSSQCHHNFMFEHHYQMSASVSRYAHISEFFNAVFVYCFCLVKNNLILFRLGAYNLLRLS